jgi:hypothetical protein
VGFDVVAEVTELSQIHGKECDERGARLVQVEVVLGEWNLSRLPTPSPIDKSKARSAANGSAGRLPFLPLCETLRCLALPSALGAGSCFGLLTGAPLLVFSPFLNVPDERNLGDHAAVPSIPFEGRPLLQNEVDTGLPLLGRAHICKIRDDLRWGIESKACWKIQ